MVRAALEPRRALLGYLLTAALTASTLGGCAAHQGEPRGTPGPSTAPLDSAEIRRILTAFDEADSAASTAGDQVALQALEVEPALHASVASVHRARLRERRQPGFSHLDPVFAVPPGDPPCFLVTGTLKLAGLELTPTDVSQFLRDRDGRWKLSHHVVVAPGAVLSARSIDGRVASAGGQAIDQARRRTIAAELFARSIGSGPRSAVAVSGVLDNQLAAGWGVYREQLAAAGATVSRELSSTEWSSCAVPTAAGTLTFFTLYATDTVRPTSAAGSTVTLPKDSPDLVSTGTAGALTGARITVSRVETFLLLVPDNAAATVLGVTDTAISATAAPAG